MKKTAQSLYLILLAFIIVSCNFKSQDTEQENLPRNIILLIGDGMGVAQIQAAMDVKQDKLNIERTTICGFTKTQTNFDYLIDSAASGTALATGEKTRLQAIGVDADGNRLDNISEIAAANGLSTGIVVTGSLPDATPAAFSAHQLKRYMTEEIAVDIANSPLNVLIGGGYDYFTQRSDNIDLTETFKERGYSVYYDIESIVPEGDFVALLAPRRVKRMLAGRGDMLPRSTDIALEALSKNENGFFLMVEGSKIDNAGHENDIDFLIAEMLDFDEAIGRAIDFAEQDGETLVLVVSDHETGGLTLIDGDVYTGEIEVHFSSRHHTGVMVPVFAYGPGAEKFGGIYDNVDIFHKMVRLLKLDTDK